MRSCLGVFFQSPAAAFGTSSVRYQLEKRAGGLAVANTPLQG